MVVFYIFFCFLFVTASVIVLLVARAAMKVSTAVLNRRNSMMSEPVGPTIGGLTRVTGSNGFCGS